VYAPHEDAHEPDAQSGRPGWRGVLDREYPSSPQLHRYASDPREADCMGLLPRTERGRALFLGNALGILPCLLTEVFESVVVADWKAERLALAEQRRDEEVIKNLTCVLAGDVNDVPHRLGQFDLVVLGDECPEAAWSVPIADVATARRVATAIVPDGYLMYGMRFPLRRALASFRVPVFYRAHARVLAAAGFPLASAYGRRPAMRPYHVHVPLDNPAVVAYWMRSGPQPAGLRPRLRLFVKDVLRRLGGPQYLFNNYLLIVRRGR
jgi:hypothetical protein